jgi:hypothetical protein
MSISAISPALRQIFELVCRVQGVNNVKLNGSSVKRTPFLKKKKSLDEPFLPLNRFLCKGWNDIHGLNRSKTTKNLDPLNRSNIFLFLLTLELMPVLACWQLRVLWWIRIYECPRGCHSVQPYNRMYPSAWFIFFVFFRFCAIPYHRTFKLNNGSGHGPSPPPRKASGVWVWCA